MAGYGGRVKIDSTLGGRGEKQSKEVTPKKSPPCDKRWGSQG